MNVISFLRQWDHLPMSRESQEPKLISNGELKRLADQGGIIVNGERVDSKQELPEFVTSLILWPKSKQHRTTWV